MSGLQFQSKTTHSLSAFGRHTICADLEMFSGMTLFIVFLYMKLIGITEAYENQI